MSRDVEQHVSRRQRLDFGICCDRQRQLALRPPAQVEDAHIVWSADDVAYEQTVPRQRQVLYMFFRTTGEDGNIRLGNNRGRFGQQTARIWRIGLYDLAVRRAGAAYAVDCVV